MKLNQLSVFVVGALVTLANAVGNTEPRAVRVDIFGMGPAVDSAAFQVVRSTIGQFVASGQADKFVVYGYGIEGGFSACVELSQLRPMSDTRAMEKQLRAIVPNSNTTSYDITLLEKC